jgi:O-antigen ligase
MELFLLQLAALLRPLASIKYAEALFEILGLGLFAILFAAALMKATLSKSLRLSVIDGAIVAFTVWCLATSVIYYEGVKIGEVAKLLVPLLSYTLVKIVVPDQREYTRLLFWIIVGFSAPTFLSAVLIAMGSRDALEVVIYWSQVARWRGAYTGSHSMAHSMTLLLMTLVLYVNFRDTGEHARRGTFRLVENILLVLLGIMALYCIYMSQVRSALLGLLVFLGIYTYMNNRRVFLLGVIGLTVVAAVTAPYWMATWFYEGEMQKQQGNEASAMDLGSARPRFWLNDIMVFAELPVDQKLAGTGIGNREDLVVEGELKGHNDWLELLTQTGIVGLMLFVGLQIAIFSRIRRMPVMERGIFIALFVSVVVMMAVSNSYIWRIQVSQLYYMILAFIEISRERERTRMAGI